MRKLWCFLSALVTGMPMLLHSQSAGNKTPNIILIMSDDMGYSDIRCFGGIIRTPNLDKIAANGIRYTQFYNTARSCPTRASLMTGLHPHQAGIGHMVDNPQEPEGYRGELNDNCVTIAEVLKTAGYKNYGVGKWHLTGKAKKGQDNSGYPLQRGFDEYYGIIGGAANFFDPHTLCRGNTFISPENDPEYRPEKFYLTDAIGDNSVKYIKNHKENKPFFMYVAFTAAHWPMQVPEKDVEPYYGQFDAGWDALRKEKYDDMVKSGLIKKEWKLSFDESVTPWEKEDHKEFEKRCMEVYAGMITNMDRNIGKIIQALQETGQLENTLIFFLQDNGGCAENLGREDGKVQRKIPENKMLAPMAPDELQTFMIPWRTRSGQPVFQGKDVMPGGPDTYASYGKGWAYCSNTPFREYKHWVHEGGIATPLIVQWPSGIKKTGEFRSVPGQLMDIMATCVDVANAKYPAEKNGKPIIPMQGKSLASSFGKDIKSDRYLFWEHESNKAVRKGKWKLVYKSTGKEKDRNLPTPYDSWELYDMEKDRTETNNIASVNPKMVKELADAWERIAWEVKVKPYP
ncbi:MAG: arylsulfatase [Dysgonamonadaceae bacterium]|nr:arylsulfatase [Dysgonamonadaceae bacterium]